MARKEEEIKPEWEVTNVGLMMFTSLMIILLAFFIMLSSMAVVDEKSELEAMGSLTGAFGILPGGLSPSQTDGGHMAPSTSPMETITNDLNHIREVLSQRLSKDRIHFLRGKTRRIISIESALLFPHDGVDLLPAMESVLLEICDIIKGNDYPVIVEAHTDDQPPRTERFKDNWEITALRSVNVVRFMIEAGGVDPARLSAYGYAGTKPMVANTSPRNRERNNRIDLILDYRQILADRGISRRGFRDRVFDFRGFSFPLFRGKEVR